MTEGSAMSDDKALVVSETRVTQRKTRALAAYGRKQPYIFCTREEYRAILEACQSERDRLLVRTLWETGARVSEVIALRECDIGDGYLLLPNLKQGKPTTKQVVLNPNSDLCLKLILYCRQHGISGLARVFPFSKEWAETIFRDASRRAGVYKPAKRNGNSKIATLA